ncbi:MAG: UDP binding domain-containing protein, partial [Candidatus Aenigmatarchaeota archaeon]
IRLEDAKILIVGVTYKKDVKDLRESPALEIIELLNKKAKRVDFFDPLIPYLKINNIDQKGIKLNEKKLKMYNCVIIVTDHSNIDYNFLRENSKFIFDTRNVYKKNYPNVIRL